MNTVVPVPAPVHTAGDYDVEAVVHDIVDHYEAKTSSLIMVLQDIQRHYRYLPLNALETVAYRMNLPKAQIYGVATFFRAFSLKPKGRHHVCVCTGTACHVRQAQIILDRLERELNIKPGQTTPDCEYSLETVNCLGACALGPLVTVDESYFGNMTVARVRDMLGKPQKPETAQPKRQPLTVHSL